MATLYERVRDKWLSRGVHINEGASEEAIDRLQQKMTITFPESFRSYLRTVNGMLPAEMDESLMSFFSVDLINNASCQRPQRPEFVDVIFADFLIGSHEYALRIARDGPSTGIYAVSGDFERQIAPTFDSFLNDYLADPERIAWFPEK